MIKRFNEFICERKTIRDYAKMKEKYTKEKGPYILNFIHEYFRDDGYVGSYRFRTERKRELREDFKTINMIANEENKTVLTKKDLEDVLELERCECLIYPFADYEEVKNFLNKLIKENHIGMYDFDIIRAGTLDNPYPFPETSLKYARETMKTVLQYFDDKMEF